MAAPGGSALPGRAAGAGCPLSAANPGVPFIAGVSASTSTQAGYFTDSNGQPKLWVCDQPYGLVMSAGRWNGAGGGTWQQDYDNYFATRAAQGITVVLIEPIGCATNGGVFVNGNTWDNVSPWTNGTDAGGGLNPAYWARIDYLLNSALAQGITVMPLFDIFYCTTAGGGTAFNGWTNAQFTTYGTAIGARYKNQPNLIWLFGDDTWFGLGWDAQFDAILAGLAAAGDNHVISVLWSPEMTSRYYTYDSTQAVWGTAHAQFNSCYTYNAGYYLVEYAYGEVANQGASSLLPPVWNDGVHYDGGTTYDHTNDRWWRQELWWCLTAGARGVTAYSINNFKWDSAGAPASVATDWSFANALPNITAAYQSWPGWNKLLPDLSSSFVTAGRGTRVAGKPSGSGTVYEPSFANSWVTASITPDGTLAVCYLTNSVTITVNTALLAPGWAAHWIDPVNGAATSAGAGPTFNSTAKGNNSQGDPDWVLVFHP